MLILRRYIIVIFCVFNYCYTNAQVFKAGEIFSSYIDVTPDTLINFNYQTSPTEDYYFDIDFDSQYDFKIEAYNVGGLGGASRSISVIPINSNSYILNGRVDSVFHNFYNYWHLTPMLKVLNYGDSINTLTNIWVNQVLYLTSNSGSAGTYVNPTDWIGNNDLYIGLKYQTLTDTIYGWIRVNCPSSNKCYIKDYSTTKFANDIHEINEGVKGIITYPNPVTNSLNILSSSVNLLNSEVEILSADGKIISTQTYSKIPDVSILPDGFYTLKVITKDKQIYISKFIKK